MTNFPQPATPFNRDDFQPDPERVAATAARNSANEAAFCEDVRARGGFVTWQNTPFGRTPVGNFTV